MTRLETETYTAMEAQSRSQAALNIVKVILYVLGMIVGIIVLVVLGILVHRLFVGAEEIIDDVEVEVETVVNDIRDDVGVVEEDISGVAKKIEPYTRWLPKTPLLELMDDFRSRSVIKTNDHETTN